MAPITIIQFIGQFLLLSIGFDFFYYWTHRILHFEPFYSKIHLDHHINTAPTTMTTITFHPIEMIIMGALFPIIGMLFDLHLYVILSVLLTFMTYNFYVHCGYEFTAKDWHKKLPTKLFLTCTVHDLHHSKFNYNFGAFTTIWDRLFGTLYPDLGNFHYQVMSKVETQILEEVEKKATLA
jgi:sterol desaturase/sphingolipid hydroxylase (fatty acid hydroxylase superfamily)